MAVHVGIEVFGDKVLERRLERFENRPRNLAGAYEVLKGEFFKNEREQFATEGASGSGGWATLKPSTIRAKASHGKNPMILQDSESLFESLTSEGGDWAGHYDTRSMFFGTRDPKAKFHQKGTRFMPRRRPVEFSTPQRRSFVKVFQRWLVIDDKAHATASMWANAGE